MWIVRLPLNRPYTFIVAAILILVLGVTAIVATPTDIFPNIDIPVVTLINAASGNAGKPLFAIAQSGVLRVQVDVPQSEAVNIRDGQKARVQVKERLGREYIGTVVRTAGSLDNAARTMLTEV